MGEFELISRYFKRPEDATSGAHLELGIGDDAAVLGSIGRDRIAISSDTLVESVHFPLNANPELVARRALRTNLSDMAAMGARPKWYTLALTLPEVDERWLADFSRGLHADAEDFGCQLIGGDTTKGPLNIGIQILGLIEPDRKPLTRSAAVAGDLLVVTGTLGDAKAALKCDLNSPLTDNYLISRYWLPSPRTDFAVQASVYIHAACDISDGLLADAGHLCSQSGVSALIELNQLPLSEQLTAFDSEAQLTALTGGDDYELCMAVAEDQLGSLEEIARNQNIRVTVIGCFEESEKDLHRVRVKDDNGKYLQIDYSGYQHF